MDVIISKLEGHLYVNISVHKRCRGTQFICVVYTQAAFRLYPTMHWAESYIQFFTSVSSHSTLFFALEGSTCTLLDIWQFVVFLPNFLSLLWYSKSLGQRWRRHLLFVSIRCEWKV